ncbi:hypothetical protein [Nonomuraea glycinis]|uniref:hypothetical protein n=1 Tax=Nonomuraea glycinis TaxID=2047744 RepID=UPI0033B3BF09
MGRLLTAIVVVAAAVLCLSPSVAGASTQMLGPSTNVCANAPIPTGSMPTAYFDWYQCGQPGTIYYNAKTVQVISDTSSGGTVTTCITPPPPAGFYATALSYSFNCEISKTPNGVLNNQQTLTNINGLPSRPYPHHLRRPVGAARLDRRRRRADLFVRVRPGRRGRRQRRIDPQALSPTRSPSLTPPAEEGVRLRRIRSRWRSRQKRPTSTTAWANADGASCGAWLASAIASELVCVDTSQVSRLRCPEKRACGV